MAILIYLLHGDESVAPGPRHVHAAHVAFEVACGWSFAWAQDAEAWMNVPEHLDSPAGIFRLQYGGTERHPLADDWWSASGLLERTDLTWGREVESELLSFAFFMTSRLEEYEAPDRYRDAHGRFLGGASLASARGWLERPEVDRRMQRWAQRFRLPLGASRQTYEVLPTFDVDSAFAYRSKGVYRTTGALARDMFKGRSAGERLRVVRGKAADPYDTYERIEALHAAFALRTRYFFLLASRGAHDRGVTWRSAGLRALIRDLASSADIGIHPGYNAHQSGTKAIAAECNRLKAILGETEASGMLHSRQHYLLQQPPKSWRDLQEAGIQHDHSMAYADTAGFRAGVARPFRAFDCERNERLDLWLHPVAVMDATLLRYERLSAEEAIDRVQRLAESVAEVGGGMEMIWHNESVSNHGEWAGSGTFPFYTACLSAALKVAKKRAPAP
jgi:hypothetical protein